MLDRKRRRGKNVTNSRGKQSSEKEKEKEVFPDSLADTVAWGGARTAHKFFP